MTHEERWNKNYDAIMQHMQSRKCRPARSHEEDRKMVNWMKFNKRMMARGQMPEERISRFLDLLKVASHWRRINQYAYILNDEQQILLEL